MIIEAIGDLLPVAVAVALSPIAIIGIVLVLRSPRARVSGPMFALGWLAGLVAVSIVVALIAARADDPDSGTSTIVNVVKIAIGALFLVLAVKQWRSRPARGEEVEMPGWMATLGSVSPSRALVLGATLSAANPKNLALTMAAAASIAEAGLDRAGTAVAIAGFVVLGSLGIAGLVVFYLLGPERASRPLAAIEQFMADNQAVISMVILVVLGAKLIGDGIGGLQH